MQSYKNRRIIVYVSLTIYVFSIIPKVLYAQNEEIWLQKLYHPEFQKDDLNRENLLSKYLYLNFQDILLPKSKFLGFIGDDFQRLKVFYESVQKVNDTVYKISGKSQVKENICNFSGKLRIKEILEYVSMHYGVDNKYNYRDFIAQGILISDYVLYEDSGQKSSGYFHGIMTLKWFLDKDGILHYDNIESFSDRYWNNQYIGNWTSYRTGKYKVSNWGEWRIPFSGDLDIGSAEFSVNPKYYSNGWEDFKNTR